MSKHTPGPWEFAGVAHSEDGEPGFFSITSGCIEVANTASGDVSTVVEECNARLIAAAPELLAALIGLFNCDALQDGYRRDDNPEWDAPEIRAARAAIAKAGSAQ